MKAAGTSTEAANGPEALEMEYLTMRRMVLLLVIALSAWLAGCSQRPLQTARDVDLNRYTGTLLSELSALEIESLAARAHGRMG